MYISFNESQFNLSAITEQEVLCYLITDQQYCAYFSSFLTSLLTAITEKTRGDHPCQVM